MPKVEQGEVVQNTGRKIVAEQFRPGKKCEGKRPRRLCGRENGSRNALGQVAGVLQRRRGMLTGGVG